MNLMQNGVMTGRQSKKFSSAIDIDAESVLDQPLGFGRKSNFNYLSVRLIAPFVEKTSDTRSHNRIEVHSLMFLAGFLSCSLFLL
jgi:D-alanyl-D-alanine dipeptidase